MALAAGPLTPIKERGDGADGEGGSGDDQQEKGETWEGTEPLGGTAAGTYPFLHICLSFVFAQKSCSQEQWLISDATCWVGLPAQSVMHGMAHMCHLFQS